MIMKYSIKVQNAKEICDQAMDGKQALDAVIKNVEGNRPLKHCNY